jgi:polysaccharide export outer membrane protein
MTRNWLFFILAGVVFCSCVPNRKMVYLQHDDLANRHNIPMDSVLRRHPMSIREIKIQPLDILNVNFESLTTEEFDFLAKSSPNSRGGGGGNNAASSLSGILVDANGEIEYPVIGKVKVGGLSVFEAEKKLQQIASQYLRDVVVRVRMLNFRYTMLGEVNGEKTITTANLRLTMAEAIAQAGGLTELADRSHVKVIRQVGNESQVYYISLLDENFIESPLYYVQQNDVIIVPPLRQRTFKKYFTSNLGMMASVITSILFLLSITRTI